MKPVVTQLELRLPPWLEALLTTAPQPLTARTPAEQARLVIDLAHRNITHQTGGPFAAAVFARASGHLIAAGVNLVMTSRLSIAHAEVVALSLAQRYCDTWDLSALDLQLVTSAEPCWMCLGAIHWSGIRTVICSARDADIRAIGFDEGHKPHDWRAALQARGITVTADVERAAAIQVLQSYQQLGGCIYNAAADNAATDNRGGSTAGSPQPADG